MDPSLHFFSAPNADDKWWCLLGHEQMAIILLNVPNVVSVCLFKCITAWLQVNSPCTTRPSYREQDWLYWPLILSSFHSSIIHSHIHSEINKFCTNSETLKTGKRKCIFCQNHVEAFHQKNPPKKQRSNKLDCKSCSSHFRFVWMQKQQIKAVVAPFDQATWQQGQASGVHSTSRQKKKNLQRKQKERGRAEGRWGGEELYMNGLDLHYKKEQGH